MPNITLATSASCLFAYWVRLGLLAGACVLIVALSGCAGTKGDEGSGINSSSVDWRNSADPIGSFLARSKNGAGLIVGDINHPLARQALTQLGIRYRWGGKSPETGFDCSGFVRHMYEKSVGLVLPRRAEEQAKVTEEINRSELKPGDLVFFNTMKRTFSHVGIYVGDGKFIHAPRPGKSVRVDDMREAYWQKRFNGARRVQVDKLEAEPAQN